MDSEGRHCTMEQLQARIDGQLGRQEEQDLEAHLAECARCRDALEGWLRFDRVMRRLPLVRAGTAFTYAVMARIRAGEKPSVLDRSLSFIPYFLGLTIVLGIMGGIFWWAGVFERVEISEGEGQVTEYLAPVLGRVSEGAQALSGWFAGGVVSAFSDAVLHIALPAGFTVIAIAVLDRVIRRRLLGRIR